MTRIGFIADVHAANHRKAGGVYKNGCNARMRAISAALHGVGDAIERNGIDTMVVCGDLFDSDTPPPAVIRAVQDEVARWVKLGAHVVLLCGNHDQHSDQQTDTALSPLALMDYVTVVEHPRSYIPSPGFALACVPFRKGKASAWLGDAVKAAMTGVGVSDVALVLHLGIEDNETPAYLQSAPDSVSLDALRALCGEYPAIKLVAAGNWHSPKRWKIKGTQPVNVVQCGAFTPSGWKDPGPAYGYVTIYDTALGKLAVESVPGPRFHTVDFDPVRLEAFEDDGHAFVRVVAESAKDVIASSQWVAHNLDSRGEVVLRKASKVALPEVGEAMACHGPTRVREVISSYLDKTVCPPEVNREHVKALVLDAVFGVGGGEDAYQ